MREAEAIPLRASGEERHFAHAVQCLRTHMYMYRVAAAEDGGEPGRYCTGRVADGQDVDLHRGRSGCASTHARTRPSEQDKDEAITGR